MKKTMIVVLLLVLFTPAFANDDTTQVNKLILESKGLLGTDPQKAIHIAEQARDLARKLEFHKGEALAVKNIGIVYFNQQKFVQALDHWMISLELFEKANDELGVCNILNNIANIYMSQGEDDKGIEYAFRSLKIAEKLKNNVRTVFALGTIGALYHNKKDPKAIEYISRALAITEKEGRPTLLGNLGEVYFDLGIAIEPKSEIANNADATALKQRKDSAKIASDYFTKALFYYESSIKEDPHGISTPFVYNGKAKVYFKQGKYQLALTNHSKAMEMALKLEDRLNQYKAYHGIGNTYRKMGDLKVAMDNYINAQKYAEEIANTDVLDLYRDMADVYFALGDFRNSRLYTIKMADKQLAVYNESQAKKVAVRDIRHNLETKESEVALLTKQRKIERQAKLGFAVGLGLILIIVVILYREFKFKVRTNRILDKQKVQIEGLLLNILPAEVAKELQDTGKATPKHYENVSVLFSDFKGFTTIADKMSPSELVSQLNTCFMAFDNIVEKYGLEKIKTIGDAYMCAGGIPSPDGNHPLKIVKAALEIQEWVRKNNQDRLVAGLEPWDIRIGIHNGPLVAGVVGKKKYAYDIWGSTVNIASRMESNGEPGRVNISSAAYEKIRDIYNCTYRGKIYAKNVGEIDMYFIDQEINEVAAIESKLEVSGVQNN